MTLGPCLEHQPMHRFGVGWVCGRCGEPINPSRPSPSDTPALTEGGYAEIAASLRQEAETRDKFSDYFDAELTAEMFAGAAAITALLARAEAAETAVHEAREAWRIRSDLYAEAQARIDALTAEVARKDEALAPFALIGTSFEEDDGWAGADKFTITFDDSRLAEIDLSCFHAALAALSPVKQEPNNG